jgi:hypothetical protein
LTRAVGGQYGRHAAAASGPFELALGDLADRSLPPLFGVDTVARQVQVYSVARDSLPRLAVVLRYEDAVDDDGETRCDVGLHR